MGREAVKHLRFAYVSSVAAAGPRAKAEPGLESTVRAVAAALWGQVGSVSSERDRRHSVNAQAVYGQRSRLDLMFGLSLSFGRMRWTCRPS